MFKEKKKQRDRVEILDMIEDIMVFLEEGDEDEYETSQQYIGMKDLFKGFVVKDWKGSNFNCSKYEVLNKILVNHAVQYYRKCWLDRNEWYHDTDKQKERVTKWKRNLERHVEEKEPQAVKAFVRKHKMNEEGKSVDAIKRWIYTVKEMIKKVEKVPANDIRRYFSG